MAELHTDDTFMHHFSLLNELKRQTQSEWENELIDDFDDYDTVPRDYRNRICIDDATPADWDALADKRLKARGVDTPQEPASEEDVDWSIAPVWASFWARNLNGQCFWYDSKPEPGSRKWTVRWECDWTARAPNFNIKCRSWTDSLRSRDVDVQTENFDLRDEQEEALEEMVRQAEDLGLYDDAIVHDLTKPLSQQIGGEHYRQGSIQPIEYIHANNMDFFSGNVVKYITRWRYKNGLEDLKKAKHYIELLMEQEYGYNG